MAAGGCSDAGIDGVADIEQGEVVVGWERFVGYIVAEQKNQNVDTHLFYSDDVTFS